MTTSDMMKRLCASNWY